jgi:hypothetical protein
MTGSQPLEIRGRRYSEPTVVENVEKRLTWLRRNAFTSGGTGWFAVGYGAFRRLTRSSQIIVPSLEPQARYTNFITQFNEDEPLSMFERWMVYLDYRRSKANDRDARKKTEIGIAAINKLLPQGVEFDRVTEEGRICFRIGGVVVPTIALSDSYRSILALAGDLVWRLILAFPESEDPLREEGIVLIDELDIHLHPLWQRQIAVWLREQCPNLQFIVATHSPLIAAGAGEDALTLKFSIEDGKSDVRQVPDVAAMNVDRILQSEAFDLVSTYSPQTQDKIDRMTALRGRARNEGHRKRGSSRNFPYSWRRCAPSVAHLHWDRSMPGSTNTSRRRCDDPCRSIAAARHPHGEGGRVARRASPGHHAQTRSDPEARILLDEARRDDAEYAAFARALKT